MPNPPVSLDTKRIEVMKICGSKYKILEDPLKLLGVPLCLSPHPSPLPRLPEHLRLDLRLLVWTGPLFYRDASWDMPTTEEESPSTEVYITNRENGRLAN